MPKHRIFRLFLNTVQPVEDLGSFDIFNNAWAVAASVTSRHSQQGRFTHSLIVYRSDDEHVENVQGTTD